MSRTVVAASASVEVRVCSAASFTAHPCTVQVVPSGVAHAAASLVAFVREDLNNKDRPQDFPCWRFSKIAPTCAGDP